MRNEYGEITSEIPYNSCAPYYGCLNLITQPQEKQELWLTINDKPIVPLRRVKRIKHGLFNNEIELY